ncbi:SET domain-containing protein [Delitschia confertaspora ATCC 74209]|uniref:SET domain-containing protein n=1 Tax=Delitschia confertaspora ATCC 74209 TaxID=1513339 RepID=A0A9P4MP70_9PLEO|nr:SET domain-containing protein [Delitschia confertaspora ATCC 74209]
MNILLPLIFITTATAFSRIELDTISHPPLSFDNACPSLPLLSGRNHIDHVDPLPPPRNQTQEYTRPTPSNPADFPWTFWPECYSNELIPEPLCVFSQQSFAGSRGISIIATSSEAHKILQIPAFTQSGVLGLVNDYTNPPYAEHDFPGKGRGLIATKTLYRGDEIFASTPLLIMDSEAYLLVEKERLKLAHHAVANLPRDSQASFWAMVHHSRGDAVDDRINTNAFDVQINGKPWHAVFPEIARINHDCRPNAAYFFDPETLTHYVHATRPIHPGEEITITYINNAQSRQQRTNSLQRNWGFHCSCAACRANPALTHESDNRLAQIEELEAKLDDWSADSEATPEMAEMLIGLSEQERLSGSMGAAYKRAAMSYSAVGDRWVAARYARLSVEYTMLERGFRDPDVWGMRALASDPEMQWSWKKRVKGCGCRP